ncbi:FAD-linked oxidoreductase-like protein [Aspergillus avenaceus]|uniref:Proline dehydrogenase n=1 Tax=Aspergillus avenaceus TaxID=36643 RepID=A0A5N6TZ55_ASPAV|nr:FAD-linked oxidoreductase-like protein [Aspergillus avenaceus]
MSSVRLLGLAGRPVNHLRIRWSRSQLPPHSLLPTKMLLRSLLVATISSHRWLLTPALKFLSLIAHPRVSVLDVTKNPVLHGIVKSTFYNHFCAGENGTEVRSTIGNIKDMGFKGVILTYAREIVVDASKQVAETTTSTPKTESSTESANNPDIEAWRRGVLETVEMVGEGDILALKLTGAGEPAMRALSTRQPLPDQMMSALKEICSRAVERQARIFIDAEQQSVQSAIDDIALALMRQFNTGSKATVYNTYQAYLKSTPDTVCAHLDIANRKGFTLGIKLVRGAYIAAEPRGLINDTKSVTYKLYNTIAKGVIKRRLRDFGNGNKPFPPAELFLATHNEESALLANRLIKEQSSAGLPATRVQYGQLLGMADGVSCRLLQLRDDDAGASGSTAPEVFKCLSWGTLGDCLSYLLRRAVENRDAVRRTKEEYLQLRKEVVRRISRGFM